MNKLLKYSLVVLMALVANSSGQRAVMVNSTNSVLLYPNNFWSVNASAARNGIGLSLSALTNTNAANFRNGIGLGTAATNPSSAFQPSSTILSNLSLGDGSGITNIPIAGVVGGLATNGNAANLTNFPASILRTNGSASGLTNFPVISVTSGGTGGSNEATARSGIGLGPTNTLTIAGIVSDNITVNSGGGITLQSVLTNAASFRTNIGLSWTGLTSVDASSFRTSLGLGTSATNPSSAFQPSSSVLTNVALGDGGDLTNIKATNLVGIIPASNIASFTFTNIGGVLTISSGGTSATNAASARANLGSTTVGDAIFTAPNAASVKTTLGATTLGNNLFGLANPSSVTFFRVNADNTVSTLGASDYRTALGLGTAATNASSAFQPYVAALDILSTNNAFFLTNVQAVNISGSVSLVNGGTGATNATGARTSLGLGSAATNEASAFQSSSTVLSNLASSNGLNLTNIPISGVISALATNGNGSGLTNLTAANITGTVAIANGGTGATNVAGIRTTLELGTNQTAQFQNVDIASFPRGFTKGFMGAVSGIVTLFGTNTTNGVPAFYGWNGSLSTNISMEQSRTNLGLSWGALTNTNAATSLYSGTATGLLGYTAETNPSGSYPTGYNILTYSNTNTLVVPANLLIGGDAVPAPRNPKNIEIRGSVTIAYPFSSPSTIYGNNYIYTTDGTTYTNEVVTFSESGVAFSNATVNGSLDFGSSLAAATARTNLGLGSSWLVSTNTPVFVSTNGDVVSPTNFWQQAPILTTVQNSAPTTNSTNSATNSRNLILQSLGTNIVNITNTILLPTNTSTFNGDSALVIHLGGSGSATAIRQTGATNNLITLTNFDHAVRFIYNAGSWDFYHNVAYVEPIYFSGTNASANAAASRTNLGLGSGITTNLVLKNSANNDTYMNFSNGILIYGSTTPP